MTSKNLQFVEEGSASGTRRGERRGHSRHFANQHKNNYLSETNKIKAVFGVTE